jgi:uncharacterized protein (TIGR00369 family)
MSKEARMKSFIPPNPAYKEAVQSMLLGMPFVQWLGLSFEHIAPGEVDFVMPNRPEITFDGKAVQAGPMGALLDFSGGAAAFTLAAAGVMLATIDFSVKLLAPAIGDRLVGRGRVISAGKSLIVARADAFALGKLGEVQVATGLVTMRAIT